LGYAIVVYFVATESPDLNIARVRQRVALGGHDAPEERIAARYRRTMDLLPDAIARSDRVPLFDNSYRQSRKGHVLLAPFLEAEISGIPPSLTVTRSKTAPGWFAGVEQPARQALSNRA
jgi:predicted ABC-type ATPase